MERFGRHDGPGAEGDLYDVEIRREYDADPADVWDACTNPGRLARWFSPVSGELRLGGRYAIEGNASGTITECDPPRRLAQDWEFDGGVSWVTAELTPADAAVWGAVHEAAGAPAAVAAKAAQATADAFAPVDKPA